MRLDKYNNGIIKIEIQALIPEKFINLLWKNGVNIKNITKINVTTMRMDIALRDYRRIEDIARRTDTKIRIVERKGLSFLMLRIRRQMALAGGIIIFVFGLYYLSTFIWNIEITTQKHLSPYEIRQMLYSYGIRPGIPKRRMNVYTLEEKIKSDNNNVLWSRVRIEGAVLKVNIMERVAPPDIVKSDTPCNIVAKMDGEVIFVYTTAGTAVVKRGDIVKAGQILVKGEQGKEGSTYPVHAQGNVIANTFYEHIQEVKIKGTKNERTGQKIEDVYINILGRKIYLKKSLNKFENYDKIDNNQKLVKKEIYFETKPVEFSLDKEKAVKETVDAMYIKTSESLDKSAKIIDKKIQEVENINDTLRIRTVFIVEQNIALEEVAQ